MTSEAPRPVYLHIGASKTGTTYLQGLLFANQEALHDEGLLVPGATWGDQVRAVRDVLRRHRHDAHIRAESEGAWASLLDEVRAPGHDRSVISMEFLASAGRDDVRRVVGSLGGDDVHVVLTLRDMAAVLPAVWQTLVHNGATYSWTEFLEAAAAWRPGRTLLVPPVAGWRQDPRRQLRRTADVPRILRRWGRAVDPERLHVVTVPRPGTPPTLLWERYAEVLGVDPTAATQPPDDANTSIGYASTELVRLVNTRLTSASRISRSEYNWTVKEHLALRILRDRAALEGRAELTQGAYDACLEMNDAVRVAVRRSGAGISGDLDDLPVVADGQASLPRSATPVDADQLLAAAADALDGLEALRTRRLRRLSRLGVERDGADHPEPGTARRRWASCPGPVDAAVDEVTARCHELALLLREVRRAKAARGR